MGCAKLYCFQHTRKYTNISHTKNCELKLIEIQFQL